MKQVIRKSVALANNIDQTKPIYTLIVDGNNLLKISLVNKTLLMIKEKNMVPYITSYVFWVRYYKCVILKHVLYVGMVI